MKTTTARARRSYDVIVTLPDSSPAQPGPRASVRSGWSAQRLLCDYMRRYPNARRIAIVSLPDVYLVWFWAGSPAQLASVQP